MPKCLKSLEWCDDVVVIDSFSTDDTEKICRAHKVRFYQHGFTGFGDQRNWALEKIKFKHDWVFVLDADEEFTPELAREVEERLATVESDVAAFRVKRRFYLWGQWLKHSSLYPTWVIRLIRKDKVRYVNRGHAETQMVDGRILALENDLKDENIKGLQAWFARQNQYSTHEAIHELQQPQAPLRQLFSREPLRRREALKALARRLPFRAAIFFTYNYFLKKGFLDGVAGFRFSLMKAMYVEMIELKKHEMKHFPALQENPHTIVAPKKRARR